MNYFFLFSFLLLVLLYDLFAIQFGFSFIDEALVVVIMSYSFLIFFINRMTLTKVEKNVLITYTLLVVLGFSGALYSSLQPYKIQFIDFIIFSKFFIAYLSVSIIVRYHQFDYKLTKSMALLIIYFAIVLTIIFLLDEIFIIFPSFDQKYFGFNSIELFFGHPSRFAFAIQTILILSLPLVIVYRSYFFFIAPLVVIGAFSLRTKFYVFLMLFFISIFFIKIFKKRKISIFKIILMMFPIGLAILYFTYDDIAIHLLKQEETQGMRGRLLFAGFDIAKNHFPLGTGFGSFGSYASTINYSSIYFDYGFDKIPGSMPDKPSFLADSYFAMLLGQFGYLGFSLTIGFMIYLFILLLNAFNHSYQDRYYYLSAIVFLLILILDGISDSTFVQNRGVFIAIYLAIIVNKFQINKAKYEI